MTVADRALKSCDCIGVDTPIYFVRTLPPRKDTFLCVGFFHCRRVVCACSVRAVGSFSNKPLSPKDRQHDALRRAQDHGQVRAALALTVLLGRLGCARFQLDQHFSRQVPDRFAAIDRVPTLPGEPASWRLSGARSHGGPDAALPSGAHHLWRLRVRAARGRLLAAGRAGCIHVETKP